MTLSKKMLIRLVSFAFFYIGWGVCMNQAAIGRPYDGPFLVFVMLVLHLIAIQNRSTEIALVVSVAFFGTFVDTLYQLFGLIEYASPYPTIPFIAPLWLTSIWVLFAMCLNHSLTWLGRHWLLASTFGAGGAMLSYLAGVKLGAAVFLHSQWVVLGIIGAVWLFAMPFSLIYASWLTKRSSNLSSVN